MRIAVVGSGISGLASAWLLSRAHEVVLFEADGRLGGHTHTHAIADGRQQLAIDTGFIVHNREHYPLLTRMFDELGVETQPTTMGFSVQCEGSGLEYNAASLGGLFCQRRNLVSPHFLGMLRDLARFYRLARELLQPGAHDPTLGEFLDRHRFGAAFRDWHIVPMASALWSAPSTQILAFPARHLAAFMDNHAMLTLGRRPAWRVVRGGSRRYVDAMRARWPVAVRLSTPVRSIRREADGVDIVHSDRSERFDHVVLATHSDDALSLLSDASERERDVLGAMPYQANDIVLHTDTRVLPRSRAAWAAWNAFVPRDDSRTATVSYCMNQLQSLQAAETYIVTLNRSSAIDPARVLSRVAYRHPVFTRAGVAAQARKAEIQGVQRTWFAGAYWRWGFHEDGMSSAVDVAAALGVPWSAGTAREPRPALHQGETPLWAPS
jgi:uncharacterized protein